MFVHVCSLSVLSPVTQQYYFNFIRTHYDETVCTGKPPKIQSQGGRGSRLLHYNRKRSTHPEGRGRSQPELTLIITPQTY